MNTTISNFPNNPSFEIRPQLLPFISDKHLTLALPVIAYWVYSLFFHFLDMQTWPWLDKYRIHPPEEILKRNRVTRWEVVRDVFVQQIIQTLTGIVVLRTEPDEGFPDHNLAIRNLQLPPWNLPNLASAELTYWFILPALRFLVALVVLDAWEYWIHRWMHVNKFLYRHLHSRHHRLYVPYAYGALYNHPIEGLVLDTLGSSIAMKVAGQSLREAMIFFVFATLKTVDDHCGWNFPWDPFQFLFSNNSVYHDIHHQTYGIKSNYSQPFFTYWDRILGTYMAPKEHNPDKSRAKETTGLQESGDSVISEVNPEPKSSGVCIIPSAPPKLVGEKSPKANGTTPRNTSRHRKANDSISTIGSRGVLVVGK